MAVHSRRVTGPGPGLSRSLLAWFDRSRRPLPWRRSRDPYRIWVAEVLLQQTRVAQAARYYERFLRRFPTVRALARASEEEVLRHWQGAGYYARARRLRAAAIRLVDEYGGRFPASLDRLEELPGFGPYISRAVASLAFDVPVVALEANGRRVAARWWAVRRDVRTAAAGRRLERCLASILTPDRPGAFNEALMELGETVCLPRNPRCPDCPVRRYCRAYLTLRDPGGIPVARRGRPRPHVRAAVVVVEQKGRYLVQRRPPHGLLGGLYEFPGGKIERGETPIAAARREIWEEAHLRPDPLEGRGVVHHAYSHFTVELHLFHARWNGRAPFLPSPSQRWASREELERLPLPKATEKIIELLYANPSRGAARRARSSRKPSFHLPRPP